MSLEEYIAKIGCNDGHGVAVAKAFIIVAWMIIESIKTTRGAK